MNATSTDLVAALMQTMATRVVSWHQQATQQVLPFKVVSGSSRVPGPFYDVALQLANDPLGSLTELRSQYGSVVGFRLFTRPAMLISDPFLTREVLVTQSSKFIKETNIFPNSSLVGKKSLLLSHGALWKRQRKWATPAFRKSVVHTYANAMVDRTQEMMDRKWCRGGIRDVYADVNDLTTQIVASSLFGGTSGLEDMAELGPAITTVYEYFTRAGNSMLTGGQIMMTPVPEWVPTPHNLKYLYSISTLDTVVYKLIAKRRERLASFKSSSDQDAPERKDVLTRLLELTRGTTTGSSLCQLSLYWPEQKLHLDKLQARDEDGGAMDDESLRDQLMTFLVAGQETSAIVLTWALVMLAVHPEVQLRLYDECMEVLGGCPPTYSDVSKLRYLEAIILETMRLVPPAYVLARYTTEDTKLGGWDVAAGTTVLVSPYLLHRDPAHWPKANDFDPERWLQGGTAALSGNDTYWPFGGGPRSCIGRNFAMLEVSLVLAIVVRQFWVGIPPGAPVPRHHALITLRPEDEVELLLSKRSATNANVNRV